MKNPLTPILFCFWIALIAGGVVYLSVVDHSVIRQDFPQRTDTYEPTGKWHLIHFLSPNCPCSQYVASYLQKRGPKLGCLEEVVVIDTAVSSQSILAKIGYHVVCLSSEALRKFYGLNGGPWLMILDPLGKLRYSGGYLGRPIHSDSEPFADLALLDRAKKELQLLPMGSFGCLSSRAEQITSDPLRLKY